MLQSLLYNVLHLVLSMVGYLFLLRAWCWACAMPTHDAVSYAVNRLSNPMYDILVRAVHPKGAWDWTSLLGALLCALLSVVLGILTTPGLAKLLWVWLAVPAIAVHWGLSLATWLALGLSVASWLAPVHPVSRSLYVLLDPVLRPIRRLLPRTGTIDFSPMVLILLCMILTALVAPFTLGL